MGAPTTGWGTARDRPGSGLGAGGCGLGSRDLVPRIPAGRRAERSGLGPLRPWFLTPAWWASPVAVRLCVGCCLPGPFFLTSPILALPVRSLYFSPFPWSPTAAQGPPTRPRPAGQSPPLGSCARALPGFAAGSELSRGGHSPWAVESEGARPGTFGFPSPTLFSRPTGMCSSSSRPVAPRGNTTWGPKKLQIPASPATRAGMVLDISGARWLEMGTNKGSGGTAVPSLWEFTRCTRSSPNFHHNPLRPLRSQLRGRSTTCQRSQSSPLQR